MITHRSRRLQGLLKDLGVGALAAVIASYCLVSIREMRSRRVCALAESGQMSQEEAMRRLGLTTPESEEGTDPPVPFVFCRFFL
jgi:hypothetical protein